LKGCEKRDLIRDDMRSQSKLYEYKQELIAKQITNQDAIDDLLCKKRLPPLQIDYKIDGVPVCQEFYQKAYNVGHSYIDERYVQ
jgi:hypothetical protein